MAITKVTTDVITDLAVTAPKLAADSVITAKIADNAVTAAKIAAGALGDQVAGISSSASATTIAGTLASTGVLTANAGVVVDNITIDGTEIDLSSGNLTLDVAGDIRLSADDNGEVHFYDGSLHYGSILEENSNLIIQSIVQDEDIIFKGDDNGSVITALTLDMSKAGAATFNAGAEFGGDVNIFGANRLINIGESGSGGTFGFLGWNDASNYLYLGNSYNSAYNTNIVINSSGNVGIGVTSPATTLHMDASGGAVLRMQRTSANASNKLELSHDGTHGTITSTNDLILSATGAERARIDASGNIQIVGGNQMTQGLFFYNGANGHLLSGIRNKSNSSYNDSGGIEFLTSGTSNAAESVKMALDTQGNLSIGAEAGGPQGGIKGKIHIDGGSSGSGIFDALAIKHINTTTTGDGPALKFEGEYNGSAWALAKLQASNGGAGYGANVEFKLHPGDSVQGSNVVNAFGLKRIVSNQIQMQLHAGGASTYADEASYTISSVANTSCLISIQSQRRAGSNSIAYDAALFFCHYGIDSGASVIELADPGGSFAPTDTDGMVCVYKGNNSANVTVKNRLGYSTGLSIQVIPFLGN